MSSSQKATHPKAPQSSIQGPQRRRSESKRDPEPSSKEDMSRVFFLLLLPLLFSPLCLAQDPNTPEGAHGSPRGTRRLQVSPQLRPHDSVSARAESVREFFNLATSQQARSHQAHRTRQQSLKPRRISSPGLDPSTQAALENILYPWSRKARRAAPPKRLNRHSRLVYRDAEGRGRIVLKVEGDTGVEWQGWGTSLAWFANFVGGLPRDHVHWVADMLFDKDKGLGMNIARYILPGGLNPDNSPELVQLPFQASPGFRQDPDKPYNWTADSNQRNVLRAAIDRGAIAEAVVYSPPWHLTINGDVSGGDQGGPNLAPAKYQAFVDYIADVIEHFQKEEGITFAGLNPFNEPLAPWWKPKSPQEGCFFPVNSMAHIMRMMRAALRWRNVRGTALVGIDDWAPRTIKALRHAPEIFNSVKRIALHAYRTPTYIHNATASGLDDFDTVRKAAELLEKEVWITEWGPWGPIPKTPSDLDLALVQSRNIIELVNANNASAFCYWQAVVPDHHYYPPPFAAGVGLIRLNFDYSAPFKPTLTKQYWAQMHFSKWVRPGCRILTVDEAIRRLILTTYDPEAQELTVTAVNQGESSFFVELSKQNGVDFRTLSRDGQSGLVFRTSKTETYDQVFSGVLGRNIHRLRPLEFQPDSVTTYVFQEVDMTSADTLWT